MIQFDHTHYVPILRWKYGERVALAKLLPHQLSRITPMVELIPENFEVKKSGRTLSVDEHLSLIAHELFRYWGPAPIFVDLNYIPPSIKTISGDHPFRLLSQFSQLSQIALIPVTNLTKDPEYQSAVRSIASAHKQGVCIRLFSSDIFDADFSHKLNHILTDLGVAQQHIDLLIDLQVVDHSIVDYSDICDRIPKLDEWRNFIVASGAFPKYLTEIEKNRQHELPRLDWLAWKRQTQAAQYP